MLSPTQWTALLKADIPWRKRNEEIARAIRGVLTHTEGEISTTALLEKLMPVAFCRGVEITARNDFAKWMMRTADTLLKDCIRRGEEERGKFGKIRRIHWHAPIAKTCPHCGGVL